MTAGIPGIGLSGLFFVISALLMVVVELYRTVRGRSSLARWRFVGRQAGIAAGIVLITSAALWLLDLAVSGGPLDPRSPAGAGSRAEGGRPGPLLEAVVEIPLSAAPILGTLAFLILVLCLAESLRWVAGRPGPLAQGQPGSGESRTPAEHRAR